MIDSPLLIPLVPPSRWDAPQAISANGTRVRFSDDVEAIDLTSGLWNVPYGYGRPEFASAISEAMRDNSYLSLFRRGHPLAVEASRALLGAAGGAFVRVFLTTSGGTANDAVMKLLRHRAALLGRPERRIVVGLTGSYHGLSYGAHALSGDHLGQDLYGTDRSGVRHVAHNDPEALERLLRREGERICGFVVEPFLGSGALEPTPELLEMLSRAAAGGIPIVADEVATGFGRTGPFLASERWPFTPDAVILSKALTNGTLAAAAVLLGERMVRDFDRADAAFVHAETQAGTPAVCAAILQSVALLPELLGPDGFPRVSTALHRLIGAIAHHPRVTAVHGRGSFRAVRLDGAGDPDQVLALVERIRRCGAVVHPAPDGIQFLPAAVLSDAEIASAAGIVLEALAS